LVPAPEGRNTRTDPQRHGPGPVLPHDTGSAAPGPARQSSWQAYPPARGRQGGRWSSAYAPARYYPAGRQARL